jgi:hypothetical protein
MGAARGAQGSFLAILQKGRVKVNDARAIKSKAQKRQWIIIFKTVFIDLQRKEETNKRHE